MAYTYLIFFSLGKILVKNNRGNKTWFLSDGGNLSDFTKREPKQ